MWPDRKDQWLNLYAPAAADNVRGRLWQYPVLRGFVDGLIDRGGQRAASIGDYLAQYPSYFRTPDHFRKWLRVIHYREALRLVYPVEPVETALQQLTEDDRRLIRLRYVDQLSDEEVGRVLGLFGPGFKVDTAAAGRLSRAAYWGLCAALPKTADVLRPGVAVMALFPHYPCGC